MNVSRFLNKSKSLSELVTPASSEEECGTCRAIGKVQCLTCQSKGFVKRYRKEQLKCEICAGGGKTLTPCLSCSGTGASTRLLRYEDKGGQGAIHQQGILFAAKRTQTVSILVQNTDEVAGKYQVIITLRDGKNTTQKSSVNLGPGETAPIALSFFPISSKDGYPAKYEIIPGEVQTKCTQCAEKGKNERTCRACEGTGLITSQREIAETCSNCIGAGQTRCGKCNGSGRIRT